MNYLSVCSGIEAATVAWHDLGWKPVGFSEIEKFPSKVLAHHYPHITNFGDMTKYKEWNINEPVELLVGGTPCQSFSLAGLRKGLDDPRGNLMLTYLAIAARNRPKWLVWENVTGVLSSNGGLDFASLLRGMGELGYGFAYRVLDAQYFGVAQRRRRVFVVGCLGDWRSAAAVLFESHSLQGHPKPSREKGKESSIFVESSFGGYRQDDIGRTTKTIGIDDEVNCKEDLMGCITTKGTTSVCYPTYALQGAGVTSQNGNGNGFNEDISFTLNSIDVHGVAVGFDVYNTAITGEISKTLDTGSDYSHLPNIFKKMTIRRITPIECERLQGFPDNYTNIPSAADGPRYKALGNSMAVPVMKWIGERINEINQQI